DESWHYGQARRVDHFAGVQIGSMRLDAPNAIPFNNDVDVSAQSVGLAVKQPARMNDFAAARLFRLPREIERHIANLAVIDRDQPQLIHRNIENLTRVTRPAQTVCG